jgi:hypothetical protein
MLAGVPGSIDQFAEQAPYARFYKLKVAIAVPVFQVYLGESFLFTN